MHKRGMENGMSKGSFWPAIVAVALLSLLTTVPLHAVDVGKSPADRWPVFRGCLEGTGVIGGTLSVTPQQLWFIETQESIEATAAIAGGVVYFPTMGGSCFALELDTGKQVWKFTNENKDPAKSSPCVTDQFVVYGDDVGTFRALDRKTGQLRWKFISEGEIISSPVEVGGRILFGSYDETLYCLDAASGKEAWRVRTRGPVHGTPSLVGQSVAIAGCDGFLRLISLADGKEVASLEIGGNIASTPAVEQRHLFFGTMSNEVFAVNSETMTKVWRFESPKRKFPFYSSPAVLGDLVVIGGRDKVVRALDKKSGEEKWAFSTGGRVDASPVIAGNTVYIGSCDGNMYGIDLPTGQKRWEYPTGSAILASPAVANGRLAVGTQDGTMFCFGSRK